MAFAQEDGAGDEEPRWTLLRAGPDDSLEMLRSKHRRLLAIHKVWPRLSVAVLRVPSVFPFPSNP